MTRRQLRFTTTTISAMKTKEIAAYVRNNVEDYEERLQLSLKRMDRMRCPMRMADEELYDDIINAIEEWCWDNDVNTEDLDWDELIDGDDGIIWED